jgi:dihydroxyacetone kinase
MKKLINRPERAVTEMLDGFLALYPGVSRLAGSNVLIRSDAETASAHQVALISGGGSGHEPAHAGYIGPGMLSAAVAGEIFTSPTARSVLAAIRATTGPLGALLIIKNYTGDRLNFGLAAEMARAEGFLVESVVVADDVALAKSEEHAGRRGLAGTVFVHKIAGAAAAEGKDLPQVASIAQAAAEQIGTMGVALSAGTAPGIEQPSFQLGNEVELGLGIHGEPGVRRVAMRSADELADELLHGVFHALRLRAGDRLAVLLNNLGATTSMELAIVGRRVFSMLESRGMTVERLYSGTFMSSLNMEGVSVSLMRVDDESLRRLDSPTLAPAWPTPPRKPPSSFLQRTIEVNGTPSEALYERPQTVIGRKAETAARAACEALLKSEAFLTDLDRTVGDGDLGYNMAQAARHLLEKLSEIPFDEPAQLLKAIGILLGNVMGGSSGPLYSAFFLRAGASLESGAAGDRKLWAAAAVEGCGAVGELGGARLGDCTMLDSLLPFAQTLTMRLADTVSTSEALAASIEAARQGADATSQMVARKGRSSYLGKRSLGTPDPGAMAAAIWLEAAANVLA